MTRISFDYSIQINAEPQAVWDYVSDLTTHGEWSEGLNVESTSDGPLAVGSTFHSVGKQLGKDVENDIRVTQLDAPNSMSFVANAGGTEFTQDMKVSGSGGGTLLERRLTFDPNPILAILFKIAIGPLAANPAMNKSLRNLKAKMEG